jgi:hypothetical protein
METAAPIDLVHVLRAALERLRPELQADLRLALREELARLGRDDLDRLLDADAAGRLLGMTPTAIRKAAERGAVPCVRVGRRLRFRVRDLLAIGQ